MRKMPRRSTLIVSALLLVTAPLTVMAALPAKAETGAGVGRDAGPVNSHQPPIVTVAPTLPAHPR